MASLPDIDIKVTVAWPPEMREHAITALDRQITDQRRIRDMAERAWEYWHAKAREENSRLDKLLAERERIANSTHTYQPEESK